MTTLSNGKFLFSAVTKVCKDGSHEVSASPAVNAGENMMSVLFCRLFIQINNVVAKA
jgi:hypothetical protein